MRGAARHEQDVIRPEGKASYQSTFMMA